MNKKLTPLGNNVIVRLIKQDSKIGTIVIPDDCIEEQTLAEVLVTPRFSYHPNGELNENSPLTVGMKVRIPKGKNGTECPEAPEGETWLAIPEDCIYYIVE